jgi:uncharacterized RDD family membrane protein YckC
VTRTFRRCNARHRINPWDDTPEAWTAVRRPYSGGVSSASDEPRPAPAGALEPLAPPNASFPRRLGAVVVDWVLCVLVVRLLPLDVTHGGLASFAPLAAFALENLLLVGTIGATAGHRVFGLQVWQVRPGAFPLQVLVRTLLLCLFVPAVVVGRDGRGLHDLAAGTRIVRLPR